MPAGNKFLLAFPDLSHAAIGGSNASEANDSGHRAHNADSAGSGESQGGGGKHGGRKRAGSGGNEASSGGQEDMTAIGGGLSPTARAIGIAAIESVTTAFLDAYVKNDNFAQEWLDKDGRRWLGERGELLRR
jgi:hypothetical protein